MSEVLSPAGERGGLYRALLIGNSRFPDDPHNLFELKGPFNDLSLLRSALTDSAVGLFEAANVRVLHEAKRQEIATAIERFFLSAAPADTLLLYYTGHGQRDEYDDLFLCAHDTRTDVLGSTAIRDADVDAMMRRSSAKRFVVVLDCCYSGAFKSGGLMPANLKGSGRFLLTSSRGTEPSSDAEQHHETSAFTRHLVDGLRLANDSNADGYVSVNEVYEHIYDKLYKETAQVPQRNFDREAVGDVALARRPIAEAMAAPPVTPSDQRPILAVSPETIELRDVGADEVLPVELIDVFNEGGGELEWTATATAPWISIVQHDTYCELKLTPSAGVNRGAVRIRDAGRGGARIVRLLVEVRAREDVAPVRAEAKPGPVLETDAPSARISPKRRSRPKATQEKERFDVVLDEPGESRAAAILALRKRQALSVEKAKQLVDSAPVTILRGATGPEARAVADSLTRAGAKARLASVSEGSPAARSRATRYDVVLLGLRPKAGRKTHVVPVIRDVTALTQKDASRLVDTAPEVLRRDLHRAESEFIVKELERVGARAEARPSEGTGRPRAPSLFRLASQKLQQKEAIPVKEVTLGTRTGTSGEPQDEGARIKSHLIALSACLAETEQVHNLAFGSLDWVDGLVAVTERRLIFIWMPGTGFSTQDFPFEQLTGIAGVTTWTAGKLQISRKSASGKSISKIFPGARKDEILEFVRTKISASI